MYNQLSIVMLCIDRESGLYRLCSHGIESAPPNKAATSV